MPGFTLVTIKSLRVGLVLRYVCVNLSKPACLVFSCVQWCALCAVETQHSAHRFAAEYKRVSISLHSHVSVLVEHTNV